MVDPGRVRRLIEDLADYRGKLATLSRLPAAEYQSDRAFAGRYLVQVSAQVCIDLASHWAKDWKTSAASPGRSRSLRILGDVSDCCRASRRYGAVLRAPCAGCDPG